MAELHRVCAVEEIPPGRMKRFEVDETPICVYNCGGAFSATHDTCSHAEASLAEGFLDCETGAVECPLHGARFDVKTGKALCLPAVSPVKSFPVEVRDGAVHVRV
jgi:3-phenylpropionate/trans-cinnamate dioxygenase ferredoxin subunit